MNTMESTMAKLNYSHQTFFTSFHNQRPSFSKPMSSISFRSPFPTPPSSRLFSNSLKLSSAPYISTIAAPSSSPSSNPQNPKPQILKTLNHFPLSLLKTTFIATITATALFFARLNLRPAMAAPISQPPSTVETTENNAVKEDETQNERALEEHLQSNPDDINALRTLMEIKFKNRKLVEVIGIIEQLMRLEPNEVEWPLFKAHIHCYSGELESAKMGFTEILEKDPLRVEAYHGLVTAALGDDWRSELVEIQKRMYKGMEVCKKEKKKEELRDFRLLLAQIRVIEGKVDEALKIYKELVKEEPRDFRPYLCQAYIYGSLGKDNEAEKCFEKYRRLVPKEHPYARYHDDIIARAQGFAKKEKDVRT